jgi:hypothetical protein
MQFYRWLRTRYRERSDQLQNAIQTQLAEAETLKTVQGYPFPIAALTQPLKMIQEELQASPAASGLSSRGVLAIPGFPIRFSNYVFNGKYADAWRRLDALGGYVERAQPTSFWYRFAAARSAWERRLQEYKTAAAAWELLTRFMEAASSPAWLGAKATRSRLDQIRRLAEGALVDTVTAEAEQGPERLLEALEAEVTAASKFQDLPTDISKLRQSIETELHSILDETRLQALGRALRPLGKEPPVPPGMGETYAETKTAFEAFNVGVAEAGKRRFEEAGGEITWAQWMRIYTRLRDDRYKTAPEDEPSLRELEKMKLIVRKVMLP